MDDLHKQYKIGYPILSKMAGLNKSNLIALLKDIFIGNSRVLELLDDDPSISKVVTIGESEHVNEITLTYYDQIQINAFGIKWKPEHGSSTSLLTFNKFFNIDL